MVAFTIKGGYLIGNGELFVIHELRHKGLSISAIGDCAIAILKLTSFLAQASSARQARAQPERALPANVSVEAEAPRQPQVRPSPASQAPISPISSGETPCLIR